MRVYSGIRRSVLDKRTIIGAAASIAGGVLGNRAAAGQASDARDFTADQYARRYRITMDDMRSAGLNPMLAYSQGPGTSPSGAMAAQGDFGGGEAGSIIAQSSMRKAQSKQASTAATQNISTAKNLDQDTKLKQIQARKTSAEISKIKGETATELQRSILVAAQGELTTKQAREVERKIDQLKAQTKLTGDQEKLLEAEILRMIRSGDSIVGKTADSILKLIPSSARALWDAIKGGITFTKER